MTSKMTKNPHSYMKRNVCILITGEFPYQTSEPFLESEIIYLSREFDKIYIFALDAQRNDKMTRKIPSNATAVPVGYTQGKIKYIKYVIKGTIRNNQAYPPHGDNIPRKLYCVYERGKAFEAYGFITNYIESNNIDVSNCVFYSYWLSDHAFVAMLLKKRYNNTALAVARAHAFDLYTERHSIGFRPYIKEKLTNLDAVCPCSDDGSEYLIKQYPEYSNIVHTERLGTIDYGITEYQDDNKVFLTCCNLKKFKRITLFAKAFCIVAKLNQSIKWVCIGQGEEFEEIKSIIRENSLESRVEFLGRLKNEDVIEYYKYHTIAYFCNVSTLEGVPVSIMEAMSFGIPIIATDVGGTSELVSSENGVLLPRDIDEEHLAKVIKNELMINREEYIKKRERARKIWDEKSSAENNYTKWSRFLSGK